MEESHSGPVRGFAKPLSRKAHAGSNPASSAFVRRSFSEVGLNFKGKVR